MQKFSAGIAISLMTVAALLLSGEAGAVELTRVNAGATEKVDAHSICWNVVNAGPNNVMVPHKTAVEWSAFRAHLPTGVTLAPCCIATGGSGCSVNTDCCSSNCSSGQCCAAGTSWTGTQCCTAPYAPGAPSVQASPWNSMLALPGTTFTPLGVDWCAATPFSSVRINFPNPLNGTLAWMDVKYPYEHTPYRLGGVIDVGYQGFSAAQVATIRAFSDFHTIQFGSWSWGGATIVPRFLFEFVSSNKITFRVQQHASTSLSCNPNFYRYTYQKIGGVWKMTLKDDELCTAWDSIWYWCTATSAAHHWNYCTGAAACASEATPYVF